MIERRAGIERRAFAKLNLDLRVDGIRADGYHELRTVFQTIDLHDVVRVERTGKEEPFTIACEDPAVPRGPDNLIWRAADRLAGAAGGGARGVRVELWKGIPAQGGLGGGSADAAVALLALAEAWRLDVTPRRLLQHAAALGADVPFFFLGGTAQARGRGDDLRAWPDLPPLEVLLVFPSFGVPTADAYRWFDEMHGRACSPGPPRRGKTRSPNALLGPDPGPPPDWRAWLSSCRNDLQPPVAARFPLIDELCDRLSASGALLAAMSGSGSTVFGLYDRAQSAETVAEELRRGGCSVARTHTLSRRRYVEEALGGLDVGAVGVRS